MDLAEVASGVPVLLLDAPPCAPRCAHKILRPSSKGVPGWRFPKAPGWSYAPLRGFGVFLEEPFQFADPINWTVGDAAGTQQTARGQAVESCRTDANRLCRLNAVQRQFWNTFKMFIAHAPVLSGRMGD